MPVNNLFHFWFFFLIKKNQNIADPMLFHNSVPGLCTYLMVYIDDKVRTGNNEEEITKLKHNLF